MSSEKLIKNSLRSEIYQGTVRDYWIYISNGYTPDVPANLMVFQDGFAYIDETKAMQVPKIIDKLVSEKVIPATVCVFVNPGIVEEPTKPEHHPDTQRSIEYDSVNDQYTRFIVNELLPEALQGLNVSQDPRPKK